MHRGLRRQRHIERFRTVVRPPRTTLSLSLPADIEPFHIDILRAIKLLKSHDIKPVAEKLPVNVATSPETIRRHLRYLRKQGLATLDPMVGYDLTEKGYLLVS